MFHDIYEKINLDPEPAFVVTNEVLYADDTVLLSSSAKNMQVLLDAVVTEGANYGLELNWTKTFQMNINSTMVITCPEGGIFGTKKSSIYLGGLISCDGKSGSEMKRRVSEGRVAFKSLAKLWPNANLRQSLKVEILNACITSKVLYSLESLWPLKVDCTRLNAFQCYCLRRILRIPPSYVSRVSNLRVLERACQTQYSDLLQQRQIRLYQKVQSMPVESMLRRLVCNLNGCPKQWHYHRNRGRPQQRWAQSVFKLMIA